MSSVVTLTLPSFILVLSINDSTSIGNRAPVPPEFTDLAVHFFNQFHTALYQSQSRCF